MKDFGIYDEISSGGENERHLADALPRLWVERPKGAEVCCRLACNRRYKGNVDRGDAYASTLLPASLNLLSLVGLPKKYSVNFFAASTAFLHAELKEDVFGLLASSTPKAAWSGDYTQPWRGPRPPRRLGNDLAGNMASLGDKRRRSEQNAYYFPGEDLYVMSYVDDILAVGLQTSSDRFYGELPQLLLPHHQQASRGAKTC